MSTLLPGLPDDVALLCLGRLPLRVQARCRRVSRAFLHSLRPQARRQLGVTETWVMLCLANDDFIEEWRASEGGVQLLLLDPLHVRCDYLPMPPEWPSNLETVAFQALPLASQQGRVLLHGLQEAYEEGDNNSIPSSWQPKDLLGMDVLLRSSCSSAPRMMEWDRFEFAWANLDGHLYIAGGRRGRGPMDGHLFYCKPYRSAERFNLVAEQWEALPDMKEKRHACSGFAMDGCFYVVGGLGDAGRPIHSGEVFDPRTGVWTLVPELWPPPIASGKPEWVEEPPAVAMVNQHLYALKYLSTQIFWYDRQRKQWVSLGDYPNEWKAAEDNKLLGMADELWLLLNDLEGPIRVISCKPPQGAGYSTLHWQTLPFQIPWSPKIVASFPIQV